MLDSFLSKSTLLAAVCTLFIAHAQAEQYPSRTSVGSHNAQGPELRNNEAPANREARTGSSSVSTPVGAPTLSRLTCSPQPAALDSNVTCAGTLLNNGSETLRVTSISSSGTVFSEPLHNCETLQPQASCDLSIRARSTKGGSFSTTLSVVTNSGTQTQSISAEWIAPGARLSATGHGNVPVGGEHTQEHRLSNTGLVPVLILADPTLSGAASFRINGEGTSRCKGGMTLSPGEHCVVQATCAPLDASTSNATLTVDTNASWTPGFGAKKASLQCNGVVLTKANDLVAVVPNLLNLGTTGVRVGTKQELTLVNQKDAPLSVGGFHFKGAQAEEFSVESHTCLSPLNKGQSCTVTVKGTPAAAGVRTAELQMQADAKTALRGVPLQVTGAVGSLGISPSSVSFGDIPVGTPSTRTVTLTNSGHMPLQMLDISWSRSLVGTFSAAIRGCSMTLPVGASCTLTLTFHPRTVAEYAGMLTISHNGDPGMGVVNLSGRGVVKP